jgi:spore coat protein H
MSWSRLISMVVFALALAGVLAADRGRPEKKPAKAPKVKKADPSDALFATNAPILTYDITIPAGEMAALQKDDRSYARGNITIGQQVFRDVAFRVKGNGSRRPLHEKPSLVVKFDHYAPDQEFFGLTKIALNNSSQDGTFLADYMANAMFADADIPVSRVTHARVKLNGRDLGLYVLVEMHNKELLKRWFRNGDGNLYEAYVADIDTQMDQDSGDDRSQADRKRLETVAKIADSHERWEKLPQVLDVDRYVSHLVCELFTSHTDGYALNRNNYRIYLNPDTGRFTFLGHGMDWAFGNTGTKMDPPPNSLITRAVVTTPEGHRLFKERRLTLFTNVFQLEVLTNRVNAAAHRLVAQARNKNETNEFQNYGRDMNNRIIARWRNVTNQLFGPPPVPLQFDDQGVAKLSGWNKKTDENSAPAAHWRGEEGEQRVLRIIATNGPTVASWRTRVTLPAGKYFFEGDVRTAGLLVKTNADAIGHGAGLRISGGKRDHKVEGDSAWTRVRYSLTNELDEVELVCELRATKGEAAFDENSLRLVRRKE